DIRQEDPIRHPARQRLDDVTGATDVEAVDQDTGLAGFAGEDLPCRDDQEDQSYATDQHLRPPLLGAGHLPADLPHECGGCLLCSRTQSPVDDAHDACSSVPGLRCPSSMMFQSRCHTAPKSDVW